MAANGVTQALQSFFYPSEQEPEYSKAKILVGAATTAMMIWLTKRSVFIPLAIAVGGFARLPLPVSPPSADESAEPKEPEESSEFSWSTLESKTLQPLFLGAYLISIYMGGAAALKAARQAATNFESCAYLIAYGVPTVAVNAWMLTIDGRRYYDSSGDCKTRFGGQIR